LTESFHIFRDDQKVTSKVVKNKVEAADLKKIGIISDQKKDSKPDGIQKINSFSNDTTMNYSEPVSLKLFQQDAPKTSSLGVDVLSKEDSLVDSTNHDKKSNFMNGVKRTISSNGRSRNNSGCSQNVNSKKFEHLDIETPSSILAHANMRDIVNLKNFYNLPAVYRYQLARLLPECDQQLYEVPVQNASTSCGIDDEMQTFPSDLPTPTVIVPAQTALTNEFITQAIGEWKEKLSEGEFTRETQSRIAVELGKEHNKVSQWKRTFFEEYYGQLQTPQKRYRSRNQNLVAESGFKIRDLGYDAQLKKFKPVETQSKQVQASMKFYDESTDSVDESDADYHGNISTTTTVHSPTVHKSADVDLNRKRTNIKNKRSLKNRTEIQPAPTQQQADESSPLINSKHEDLNHPDPQLLISKPSPVAIIMRPNGELFQRYFDNNRNLRPITNVEVFTSNPTESKTDSNSDDWSKNDCDLIIRKCSEDFGGSSAIGDHSYMTPSWWKSSKVSKSSESNTESTVGRENKSKETTLRMFPNLGFPSLKIVKKLNPTRCDEKKINYTSRSHISSSNEKEQILKLNARSFPTNFLFTNSTIQDNLQKVEFDTTVTSTSFSLSKIALPQSKACSIGATTATTTSNWKIRKKKEIRLENTISKLRKVDDCQPEESQITSSSSQLTPPTTVIVSGSTSKKIPGSTLITIECPLRTTICSSSPNFVSRTPTSQTPVQTSTTKDFSHFSVTTNNCKLQQTAVAVNLPPQSLVCNETSVSTKPITSLSTSTTFNSSNSPVVPSRFPSNSVKQASSPSSCAPPLIKWGASSICSSSQAIKKTRTLGGIKENLAARRAKSAFDTSSTSVADTSTNSHIFSTPTFPVYFQKPTSETSSNTLIKSSHSTYLRISNPPGNKLETHKNLQQVVVPPSFSNLNKHRSNILTSHTCSISTTISPSPRSTSTSASHTAISNSPTMSIRPTKHETRKRPITLKFKKTDSGVLQVKFT